MMQFGSPDFFRFLLWCFAIILAICALVTFCVREFRERKKKKQEIASKTIRCFADAGDGCVNVYSETAQLLITLTPNFWYTTFLNDSVFVRLIFFCEDKQNKDKFFIRHEDLSTLELIKRLSVK